MSITNRTALKDYCLRALGHPMIQINVSPEQIEDRIDEGFEKYWEFHGDGSIRSFYRHVVTAQDIENKYVYIPDRIISIIKVVKGSILFSNVNNLEAMAFYQSLMTAPLGSLSTLAIRMSYLSLLEDFLVQAKQLRFNQNYNKVFIDTDWRLIKENEMLIFECYEISNPNVHTRVFNDKWLKDYCIALIKRQWGQNMLKYNGFQLPSGISLDGRAIYEDALQEIEQLEVVLQNTYSLPTDFYMG